MRIEKCFSHDHVGSDKFAIRPQCTLVDEDFTITFYDQARRPRFRYPCAVDLSCLEQGQNVGIISWDYLYVSTFVRRLETILLEIIAQRDILGTPKLRISKFFVGQVFGCLNVCSWTHNEQSSTARSCSNNPQRFTMTFHIAINSRAGANVANVNVTGKKRFNQRRTCIEGLRC